MIPPIPLIPQPSKHYQLKIYISARYRALAAGPQDINMDEQEDTLTKMNIFHAGLPLLEKEIVEQHGKRYLSADSERFSSHEDRRMAYH